MGGDGEEGHEAGAGQGGEGRGEWRGRARGGGGTGWGGGGVGRGGREDGDRGRVERGRRGGRTPLSPWSISVKVLVPCVFATVSIALTSENACVGCLNVLPMFVAAMTTA